MGNTANNNWPYPESTDLVKDGATAIENLADAIDTTLGVFVPSSPGLTLINTTSFSAVASQSINNVFSSSYQSYQIIFRGTQSSASAFSIRVRAGGSDLSTTSYRWAHHFNINSNSAYTGDALGSDTSINLVGGQVDAGFYVIEVNNPFALAKTSFHHRAHFLNGTNSYNVSGSGLVNDSVSYDGFTFRSASGTLTGNVSVYGYSE
jgi:hypothetical protein